MTLTHENYFNPAADKQYMSCSQFKAFSECEAKALAVIDGRWQREVSDSMLIGSYIDAHFSGTLNLFKAQHPEIFSKKTGDLLSDFQKANAVIARIERDEMFMEALSGDKQVILTGEIEDVPVKIMIDSLHPTRTVDLKIMKDFDPVWVDGEGRVSFIRAWRYDLQGAIYQEIRRQNEGGQNKRFGLAAATKEKEPDIGLFDIPQMDLDAALAEVRARIVYFDAIKKGLADPERCEKCDYCRNTKKLKGWVVFDA